MWLSTQTDGSLYPFSRPEISCLGDPAPLGGRSDDCSVPSPLLSDHYGGSGTRHVRGSSAGHQGQRAHSRCAGIRAAPASPLHGAQRRSGASGTETRAPLVGEAGGGRGLRARRRRPARKPGPTARPELGQRLQSGQPLWGWAQATPVQPCRHSAAPARPRPNKNEPAGARQCCHTQGDAATARPDPAERPPDSPAPPAPPGSPLLPPFRRRQPRPRHAAQQRLIGQRRFPPLPARAGPRASGTTGPPPRTALQPVAAARWV